MIVPTFLATAGVAGHLLGDDAVARRWHEDSALTGYTVGGLAAHLSRALLTVAVYLDTATTDVPASTDAVGYFLAVLGDHDPVASAFHRAVRERATASADAGPQAVHAAFTEAHRSLAERLSPETVAATVTVLDGVTLQVGDYLRTRLVELVVHLDDLAVSVDLEPPAVAEDAYEVVAATLARLAARRLGGLDVVRSLARRERHPDAVRAL
ncbi:maleylpyruvate isomerase N-terminal domain-containing protein [Egicoccus sp. AB-alg6-2]|uniref:maleylpyruvate isomerase N-terminal domain-containing protein n=1 Tax=Egicoccus sp. AB-alg6-2 TaxID=3242692 RepID=UPI00359E759C